MILSLLFEVSLWPESLPSRTALMPLKDISDKSHRSSTKGQRFAGFSSVTCEAAFGMWNRRDQQWQIIPNRIGNYPNAKINIWKEIRRPERTQSAVEKEFRLNN